MKYYPDLTSVEGGPGILPGAPAVEPVAPQDVALSAARPEASCRRSGLLWSLWWWKRRRKEYSDG